MASSRFVAHVRLWFFIVPLLAVFVMPAIPDRSLFEIPANEADSVASVLGNDRAGQAVDHTNSLFRHAFVDSGVMLATIDATRSKGLNDGGVTTFAHTWVRNFWLLKFRTHVCAKVVTPPSLRPLDRVASIVASITPESTNACRNSEFV